MTFGTIETGLNAIGEAINSAKTALLLRFANDSPSVSAESHKVLAEASEGLCRSGAIDSLLFLSQKYPHLFDRLLLLQADRSSENPFRRNPNWIYHAFFLARDQNSRWYAASPGNYVPGQLETAIHQGNLEQVMTSIELAEGGKWPLASHIRIITEYIYISPIVEISPDGRQTLYLSMITRTGDFGDKELVSLQKFTF